MIANLVHGHIFSVFPIEIFLASMEIALGPLGSLHTDQAKNKNGTTVKKIEGAIILFYFVHDGHKSHILEKITKTGLG